MNKRRRLAPSKDPSKSSNSTSDLVSLLAASSSSSNDCASAFSPTANLIALAAPRSTPTSSNPIDTWLFPTASQDVPEPIPALAIHLTYLSGPSTVPVPRLNFRLQLPLPSIATSFPSSSSASSNAEIKIKILSFSPDGAYLLCVSGSEDAENDGTDDYLTVFEQSDTGCIDQWTLVLHEQAATFGARGTGTTMANGATDGKEVISVRWVGEPRAWYPSPDYTHGGAAESTRRPFVCAPPRSSPLSGAAFVAVLSSDEIVFVHLPRTSPLLPNIVCMPLHPPPSALASPSLSSTDLPEITTVSPSRRTLSLTAVATPPTSLPLSNSHESTLPILAGLSVGEVPPDHPTPSSRISQLVGSLVSALPSLDASLPLPVAPSPAAGAGNAALKEELRAAELANSIGGESVNGGSKRRRRVGLADVGAVRGSRETSESGLTTFLVATLARRSRSNPRHSTPEPNTNALSSSNGCPSLPTKPELDSDPTTSLGINMNLDEENFDMAALEGFDFGSLDAAFGSSTDTTAKAFSSLDNLAPTSPDKKVNRVVDVEGWTDWEKRNSGCQEASAGRDDWRIELSEIKIDMLNSDGPRLTVKPQPHFFASPRICPPNGIEDGHDTALDGRITQIAFLEDNDLPEMQTFTKLSAADLRLLVVSTSLTYPQTSLSSYEFSNEPYALSEAFSLLECRKAEVHVADLGEWSPRMVAESQLPGSTVLTALCPRPLGRDLGSFVAVVSEPTSATPLDTRGENKWQSRVTVVSSESLLPLESLAVTPLPIDHLYSSILLSPNAAVLVCLPRATKFSEVRPIIAASPCLHDPDTRLALALIKQNDTTDSIGVATAENADPHSDRNLIAMTQSLVQDQMSLNRPVHDTSIQFDLLGIAAALLSSSAAKRDPISTLKLETAYGLVDCAAALRAFAKGEKKDRGADSRDSKSYRCETDALWPLVGHATWYREFVENLVRATLCSHPDTPSPLLLHFLHPTARSLHQGVLDSILGLSSTLSALAAGPEPGTGLSEHEMIDLANKVVEDAVRGDETGGLDKWKTLLVKIEEVEGLDQGTAFASSLSTLDVPPSFYPQSTSVLSHIRQTYPALDSSSSDSLPRSPERRANERDAIRKCQIASSQGQSKSPVRMKQCLRCGRKSGAVTAMEEAQGGVWATFEESWRSRCACGGLWRTI